MEASDDSDVEIISGFPDKAKFKPSAGRPREMLQFYGMAGPRSMPRSLPPAKAKQSIGKKRKRAASADNKPKKKPRKVTQEEHIKHVVDA